MESTQERNQIDSWIHGVKYEVAFWNAFYLHRRDRERIAAKILKPRDFALPHFDLSELGEKDDYVILDVGCGLGGFLGRLFKGRELDIHNIDPLAIHYNRILAKHGIAPPHLVEYAMVEYLSAFYEPNSADLIVIKNALDHSFDPLKGIRESLKVLKPGGCLYLNHFSRVAEKEAYLGFHQWNIDEENGRLILWRPDTRIDVAGSLDGRARVEVESFREKGDVIVARLFKVGSDETRDEECRRDTRTLAWNLMYAIDDINSARFCTRYHISYAWLRLMHFFSKIAPVELRKGIKRRLASLRGVR